MRRKSCILFPNSWILMRRKSWILSCHPGPQISYETDRERERVPFPWSFDIQVKQGVRRKQFPHLKFEKRQRKSLGQDWNDVGNTGIRNCIRPISINFLFYFWKYPTVPVISALVSAVASRGAAKTQVGKANHEQRRLSENHPCLLILKFLNILNSWSTPFLCDSDSFKGSPISLFYPILPFLMWSAFYTWTEKKPLLLGGNYVIIQKQQNFMKVLMLCHFHLHTDERWSCF